MDRSASDYSQSDQASAAQYTPQSEVRSATGLSNSNTPQSDYSLNPSSARSAGYPAEYLTRHPPYQPASSHPGAVVGTMAQATSPSLSLQDGGPPHDHPSASRIKSDSDVPIDPSIAQQTSPAAYHYPFNGGPHPNAQPNPHPNPHEMNYQHPPGMYPNQSEWPPRYQGLPGPPNSGSPLTPSSRSGPGPGGQVYSFVPIPGAQQHKRPRRRYEEIERMYKCGWSGCEKAYGTLNHLNAHVTMQSHGNKRTPEDPSIAQQTSPAAYQPPPPYPSPFNGPHPGGPHEIYNPHPHPAGMYPHPNQPVWPPRYPDQHQHPNSSVSASPLTGGPRSGPTQQSQVYSFVPIPGAQQHKRPRRRYEEIERMYKCGWSGCEKAYGTLNHLNAHVTMQSHGNKRTPEEFKEIRKEWKARKKEEDSQRKEEERSRGQPSQVDGQEPAPGQGPSYPQGQQGPRPHLPPITQHGPASELPSNYPGQQGGIQQQGAIGYPQGNSHINQYSQFPNGQYSPHPPYPQQGHQVGQQVYPQQQQQYTGQP